jgi:hypothetical protein
MHQVTILWNDCEIGYGEGESLSYAKSEAIESVDGMYASVRSEWTFSVVRS